MEDLLTLVIAIAIGLFSLFAGQRNKNKKTAPNQQSNDIDYVPTEELEREHTAETTASPQSAQPSALDILGRILTGDLSDLVGQPKPRTPAHDSEYIDPMSARRRAQTKKEADKKERWDIEDLLSKKKVKPPSPTALALRKPGALRQAIIINELLDKPVSKRHRNRVG
jgi:type IV secretory pathway VirB10-like protein